MLRKRMVDVINHDEILVDMFAAVGNLSLQPIYHKQVKAILIEQDPYTFSYLQKTLQYNKITVKTINDDCRNVILENIADRIFMGYHDVDFTHVKKAIEIAKDKCHIHLHPIGKEDNFEEWKRIYKNWIESLDVNVVNISAHKVKNYSPGLVHIEIIITIEK